jgi:hypothetical protein
VNAATAFCQSKGVMLSAIELLPAPSMECLERINDAVDAMISPDSLRRKFLGHQRLVNTLYNAVKPDPAALEFSGRVSCLSTIADTIRAKLNPNPVDMPGVTDVDFQRLRPRSQRDGSRSARDRESRARKASAVLLPDCSYPLGKIKGIRHCVHLTKPAPAAAE